MMRAAKKAPEEFRAAYRSFYVAHQDLVTSTLTAPFIAAGLTTNAAEYAQRHIDESLRLMESGISMEELADWPEERAAQIVQSLLGEQRK
jgi:hypothetical protein